jgi:hypothetical protein
LVLVALVDYLAEQLEQMVLTLRLILLHQQEVVAVHQGEIKM